MSGGRIDKDGCSFVFNGIATLAVIVGAAFGFLGYHLFILGAAVDTEGHVKATTGKFMGVEVTGHGPGIIFIGLGAVVIIFAVLSASVGWLAKPSSESTPRAGKKR